MPWLDIVILNCVDNLGSFPNGDTRNEAGNYLSAYQRLCIAKLQIIDVTTLKLYTVNVSDLK